MNFTEEIREMAMNKREKAMVEELRVQASFYRTLEVLPDVEIPEGFNELATGYMYIGERGNTPHVQEACSSGVSHAIGSTTKTQARNPIRMYSTKLLALRALRYSVEQDSTQRLRKIDEMIETEMASNE